MSCWSACTYDLEVMVPEKRTVLGPLTMTKGNSPSRSQAMGVAEGQKMVYVVSLPL